MLYQLSYRRLASTGCGGAAPQGRAGQSYAGSGTRTPAVQARLQVSENIQTRMAKTVARAYKKLVPRPRHVGLRLQLARLCTERGEL